MSILDCEDGIDEARWDHLMASVRELSTPADFQAQDVARWYRYRNYQVTGQWLREDWAINAVLRHLFGLERELGDEFWQAIEAYPGLLAEEAHSKTEDGWVADAALDQFREAFNLDAGVDYEGELR